MIIYENIANILSGIERRVVELNDCSSDDFIMLNNYLKRQYSRIEKISGNVSDVFELRAGNENLKLHSRINKFYEKFNDVVKCSEKRFKDNVDVLEMIISYMSLMYIPFKNFTQNIVTLNFLSNSLKFKLIYPEFKDRHIFDGEIEALKNAIKELNSVNAVFDEISLEVKVLYENILAKYREIQEANIFNLDKTDDKVNLIFSKLESKHQEGNIKIPELKRKKKRYSDNVNKIIINLQYSDIIRQKIEHISDAHRDMINKMNVIKQNANQKAIDNFMLQIKDIADLQVAQLIRTSGEYQNAVKVISERFIEIGQDINELTYDTLMLSKLKSLNINTEYDFYDINEPLSVIIERTKEIEMHNTAVEGDFNKILKRLKLYTENFNKYKKLEKIIEDSIDSVLTKSKENFTDTTRIQEQLNQYSNIAQTIVGNNVEISKYYDLCEQNKNNIVLTKDVEDCSKFDDFSEEISKILSQTAENNKHIREVVIETNNLEKEVSTEINSAIREIKYYKVYENAASDIIEKLHELYETIDLKHKSIGEKAENLETQSAHYTMQSERDIHKQILEGTEVQSSNEEENEIEFF